MTTARRQILLFIASAFALELMAADWPQWRGPQRDGVAEGITLPMPWPRKLKQVWRIPAGEGHCGPVVVDGKVVLLVRKGDEEVAVCFDASNGKQLWRDAYPVAFTPVPVARGHKKGPFATSAVAAGKVYTYGTTGVLSCYELASGKRLWRYDPSGEFDKTYPLYGHSCSPLIEANLCIVGIGADDNGAVAAFDKDTGKEVWRYSHDGPSYCSGIVAELAGKRQIVTFTQKQLVGLDPADGTLLWSVSHPTQHTMNIPSPIVYKGMVIYTGFRKPLSAAEIVRRGDAFAVEPVWSNRNFAIYMTSSVTSGDHLYGLAMRGYQRAALGCVDLRSGKVAWESKRMPYYASIVRVGRRLLVSSINGELLLVAAAPGRYAEIGRAKLSSKPVWAHIAPVGNRLYVKDQTELICFELGGG